MESRSLVSVLVFISLFVFFDFADALTYTYTGDIYTNFSSTSGSIYENKNASGSFSVDGNLQANLNLRDATSIVGFSFSFFDGASENYSGPSATNGVTVDKFLISTDSLGFISAWDIVLFNDGYGPYTHLRNTLALSSSSGDRAKWASTASCDDSLLTNGNCNPLLYDEAWTSIGQTGNSGVGSWAVADVGGIDTSPVPEPSTWLLLGTGLAGLAYFRRKKS